MSKNKKQGQRDAARPDSKVSSFDEVVGLVKERRKYADWIAALEAKQDQTPAAVYSKVHLDYETRLNAAIEKLESHREVFTEERANLQRKLEGVEGQIEHHQEQRSETELRAQIGELKAAALTEALRVHDTELERLEEKRDAIESDLARVTEFFAALDGAAAHAAAPKSKSRGFDEMSFLQSVVGGEKPSAPTRPSRPEIKAESAPPLKPVEVPAKPPAEVPAPAPPPPAPTHEPAPTPAPEPKPPTPAPAPAPETPSVPVAPRASIEKPAAELMQAEGVADKAKEPEPAPSKKDTNPRQSIAMTMASLTMEPGTGAKAQSDLGIIKTGDELPPSILADLAPGADGHKPLAANVASNNPVSLKGSGAPSDLKTLKCRECGSMNDPSEWYCERCGAELSAI
jgi:hypothetical protein